MLTKSTDYFPSAELIKDPELKKFTEDLVTSLQKLQKNLYEDLIELYIAAVTNLSFYQSDVAANQSAVAIDVLGLSGNTEFIMFKAGHIVGISVASNAARSGGTLTVDVTINGTVTALQAVLNGTNTTYHYASQDREADTFSKGNRIGVKITTDASWAPTTADIVVTVFMAF